ncbi:MAG: hypothetical protein HY398_00865 [Candidatus Doudnabacteria bacterium]|nr:hypothetical protein [Candidatus Doudnabacteria bacterium]
MKREEIGRGLISGGVCIIVYVMYVLAVCRWDTHVFDSRETIAFVAGAGLLGFASVLFYPALRDVWPMVIALCINFVREKILPSRIFWSMIGAASWTIVFPIRNGDWRIGNLLVWVLPFVVVDLLRRHHRHQH